MTCHRRSSTGRHPPPTASTRDNERALLTKNLTLIDAAAAELGHIGLEDALRMLVVMAEKGDPRFERSSARFAARVTIERRLSPAEAHRVLALAQTLPSAPEAAAGLVRPFVE